MTAARRPFTITIAAVLQLLLAATFLLVDLCAARYGPDAQTASEAALVRQGLPADLYARNGIRFDEDAGVLVLALVIALVFTALAVLNLRQRRAGRILTWILQPLILVAGGLIAFGQVAVDRFVAATVEGSHDAMLRGSDVQAVMDAAHGAFPDWFPYLVAVRFALITAGSLAVLALLAVTRSARRPSPRRDGAGAPPRPAPRAG